MNEQPRDRGFTLPEVLISIGLVGLVAGAVALAFSVIVRSLPPAEARADDARTLSGLTTYLPEDVGSTPPDGFVLDDPAHLTGCAGDSPGLGLARLTWTDGSSTWIADYRLDGDASGTRIVRHACSPGGVADVATLTSRLPGVDPSTWQPGDAPAAMVAIRDDLDRVVGFVLTVTTESGTTAEMVVRSNNPDERLSEAATTTSVVIGTTTTTTTTTLPEGVTTTTTTLPACVAVSLEATPSNPTNDTGRSAKSMDALREHVDVTAATSGSCTNLVLEFDPDLSDGTYDPQWLSFGVSGSGTVTIEAHPAGADWSDGVHTLTLRNGIGSPALAEIDLVVS